MQLRLESEYHPKPVVVLFPDLLIHLRVPIIIIIIIIIIATPRDQKPTCLQVQSCLRACYRTSEVESLVIEGL